MTPAQVSEAMRLASLLATARVRRFAFKANMTSMETYTTVERRIRQAKDNLEKYLCSIPSNTSAATPETLPSDTTTS